MSQVITKRFRVSRRRFLRGLALAGGAVQVGLPPLVSMFNSTGTAYAADGLAQKPIESRFVFWFNGNGIPERYWIPSETGTDYRLSPCLGPLAPFRNDIHVLSGLDNQAAAASGPGNGHHKAISGVTTCTPFTGHGAGGASIDQVIAARIGRESRFSSIQIGVSQESFGESIQRNMSWAGYDRPLPPQMLPDKLFDYLFGARDPGWVNRKRSILDAVREDAADLRKQLPKDDVLRVDEHLSAVRDLERAIAGLPPEYQRIDAPDYDGEMGDMKDWPRIAKLQSDLLAHALVTRQTRVASYMLTKGQGLARFPWLGLTAARHHDYTHADGKAPGADGADGQRVLRDITRWHVEEFAYLLAKLKSIPEGDGTVLDHCCLLYAHEHAEANPHKCSGLAMIVAGHAGRLKTGAHTRVMGTIGDLYLTLADDIMEANLGRFPTASKKMTEILA
ncbi:MAG TPA: DUF1552 domain-containing protein [Candidatus Acidoferrales bacterium]|jgi:hypothetical protein|nr:DUF1552 domain-containing protein [Candidatus Acidoferrales bacterium]